MVTSSDTCLLQVSGLNSQSEPGSLLNPRRGLTQRALCTHSWQESEAPGPDKSWGALKVQPLTLLLTLTFLGDADGATAHAHTQPVYTSVN